MGSGTKVLAALLTVCLLTACLPWACARSERAAGQSQGARQPIAGGERQMRAVTPDGEGKPAPAPTAVVPVPPQVAYLIAELPSGRVMASARPDILSSPIAPGSIAKIAALMAALESGVIGPTTTMTCRRRVLFEGRVLTCSHPDVGHPLTPSEALAHSCNDFFVAVGRRLRREALNVALVRLGLAPISGDAPIVPAALGLEGVRATPEALLRGFVRLVVRQPIPGLREATSRVLVDGLRGSATYGTAAALARAGLDAMAKTGTAPMPGGGYLGIVVAVMPAGQPSRGIVVVAPGGAGLDAAAIAADLLAGRARGESEQRDRLEGRSPRPGQVLRVGQVTPGGGYRVVSMDLEEYVARVVAGEAAPGSRPQALEALALTARTFALVNRDRHEADGFDLCDLTHCQVLGRATPESRAAAVSTTGRVLLFNGLLARVFYTASCGGSSEVTSAVWPLASDEPYLVRHAEPECGRITAWASEITAIDLRRALRAAGVRGGELRALEVVDRSRSGRVTRIHVSGLAPAELTGEEFRLAVGRTLGWNLLKSSLFEVTRTAAGYRFSGRGAGHGVGLCVAGSARLAARGENLVAILRVYFPGLVVGPIPAGPGEASNATEILVRVPAPDASEQSPTRDLVQRELDRLVRVTGLRAPPRVRLVFHPTPESYERATGEPWWTSGASREDQIDLVPLSVLRRRGVLESTLGHELAHWLTSPVLAGRPLWVKEGAAQFFAGEHVEAARTVPGAVTSRTVCPSDMEMQPRRLLCERDCRGKAVGRDTLKRER